MGPFSGPTMQLGISGGILEPILGLWGTTGVVPVGPLLAVLMSLQQGRVGVRSTVTLRYVGHFAGFCPLSGLFLGRFQRPNTAPPSAATGPLDGEDATWLRSAPAMRAKERPSISGLADFLMLQAVMRPRPGLTQSFKRQPFQALSLRSVLAGRTPPPI